MARDSNTLQIRINQSNQALLLDMCNENTFLVLDRSTQQSPPKVSCLKGAELLIHHTTTWKQINMRIL